MTELPLTSNGYKTIAISVIAITHSFVHLKILDYS